MLRRWWTRHSAHGTQARGLGLGLRISTAIPLASRLPIRAITPLPLPKWTGWKPCCAALWRVGISRLPKLLPIPIWPPRAKAIPARGLIGSVWRARGYQSGLRQMPPQTPRSSFRPHALLAIPMRPQVLYSPPFACAFAHGRGVRWMAGTRPLPVTWPAALPQILSR